MKPSFYTRMCRPRLAMGVLILASPAWAQMMGGGMSPAEIQQKVTESMQANTEAMKHYSWKTRTEIRKDGEVKGTQLSLMRYDSYGNLEKTPMGGSQPPQEKKRGIRGHIVEKKTEEFKGSVEDLAALAKSYSNLSPAAMQNFKQNATIGKKLSGGSDIQVSSKDVVHPGDSMIITIDPATKKEKRVDITSALDGNPVTITSNFSSLSDGLTYVSDSSISYPKEGLVIRTENFDYEKQAQ